jgi:hypothetical protein
VFENFALPDLARVSRRTMLTALGFGVAGLLVCAAFGAPLVGLGICLGVGGGVVNFRMVQRSVVKVSGRGDENYKKPLASNTVVRLGALTVLSLGLLFLSFELGLGVMVGLAGFQFFLLLNVAVSMFKMGQSTLTGGDGTGGVAQ